MKKILALLTFCILVSTTGFAQSSDNVVRLSDPVWESEDYELFGISDQTDLLENPISLKTAIAKDSESFDAAFVTEVTQVCQKKGCFFIAKDDDVTARVTFIDYSFFIPTDSFGKEVVLYGTFTETVLTEDQAKHYAEDAGKDPDLVVGEQKEYSIVATSVLVPKTK